VGPLPPLQVPLVGELDASAEKRQQFFSGPEPQFARGIHFLDPSFVVLARGLRVRTQAEDERRSHHTMKVSRQRHSVVKIALELPFNFR
jgi:hypothetical protein